MRTPSITLPSSIFEPLYARADEELHFQPTKLTQPDWPWPPQSFLSSPSAASSAPPHPNTQPSSTQSCPPSRSRSSIDCSSDGSVASKLLASIPKSISTPSLPACCKESVRETPYQRALRLREMKLQHCAEELGSESSDGGSLSNGGPDSIFNSSGSVMGTLERSAHPLMMTEIMNEAHPKSEGNPAAAMVSVRSPTPAMVSVRSSPNMRVLSKTKERSFPPPLITHTLPRSNSSDSFSYSLRAYREGGHFLLKEVKVPCRQYFQSSRKDGRLTLRLFTMAEDSDRQYGEDDKGLQTDMEVGLHPAIISDCVGDGTSEKTDVDQSIEGASCVGEIRVCRGEGSKQIDVGMNSYGEKGADAAEPFRCPSASDTLHSDGSARSKKARINGISQTGPLSKEGIDIMAAHRKTSCTVVIHPPESFPKLPLMAHEPNASRVSACGASFAMDLRGAGSASNGGAKLIFTQAGVEVQQPVGYALSGSKAAASMVTCKLDITTGKCLMENLSKSVTAPVGKMVEGVVDWPSGGEDKKRSRERDGIKDCAMYHGIRNIKVGVREMELINHQKANYRINGGAVSFEMRQGRKSRRSSSAVRQESGGDHMDGTCTAASSGSGRRHPISSCHVGDLQEVVPSSRHSQAGLLAQQGKLQGKEWLHALHCKEILYRNQQQLELPGKSFMKLHCVAS